MERQNEIIDIINKQPTVSTKDIDEMYLQAVKENAELKKQLAAGDWILCSDQMPEEYDSIFAKAKGTDKWKAGMFEKTSNDVIITVEFKDGTRMTKVSRTLDGKWKIEREMIYYEPKVIAWQQLPEPYNLNLRKE